MHAQTVEFVRAAHELHDGGQEWLYPEEVELQMIHNRAAESTGLASRYERFRGLLRQASIRLGFASFEHQIPITDKLEEKGKLETDWESAHTQKEGHPQKRILRLVGNPRMT